MSKGSCCRSFCHLKLDGFGFPFMVRYPFDLLRAVSKVEPLTTNGKSDTYALSHPFALGYRRVNGTFHETSRGPFVSSSRHFLRSIFSAGAFGQRSHQLNLTGHFVFGQSLGNKASGSGLLCTHCFSALPGQPICGPGARREDRERRFLSKAPSP